MPSKLDGYHYSISQSAVETPEWVAFYTVELKAVHGRTQSGLQYFTLYMMMMIIIMMTMTTTTTTMTMTTPTTTTMMMMTMMMTRMSKMRMTMVMMVMMSTNIRN